MKKITEAIIRKEATINKIQFDKEWFYVVDDVADFLNEDFTGIETVTLPIMIDDQSYNMLCATWEDFERIRQKEPLEDFRGSVLRDKSALKKKK